MRRRLRMFVAVSLLGFQNDLCRLHTAGAGHFAALALAAQQHPAVLRLVSFRAETLRVRSGLFRSGKFGIDPKDRTVLHANRTAYAMFKFHRAGTPRRIVLQHGLWPARDRGRSRFSEFGYRRECCRRQKYFSTEHQAGAWMRRP